MKKLAILAFATLSAQSAFAGGLAAPAPEPVIVTPAPAYVAPSGDWTGFYAGAQLGYGNATSNTSGVDGNGAIGGVHAGYRYDFGRGVVGGEIDYNIANIESDLGNNSVDKVGRLKLMLGADLGRTLLYVTAGGARAEATVGGNSFYDNGYFAGVGVDYQLTDSFTVGGEVLGHRFDNFNDTGIDVKATTVQAKVAYRF